MSTIRTGSCELWVLMRYRSYLPFLLNSTRAVISWSLFHISLDQASFPVVTPSPCAGFVGPVCSSNEGRLDQEFSGF